MVYDIMNDAQRKNYEENLECDFSFAIPSLARFRVNAFNQNRGAGAVFRTIPSKILTLEELNAPEDLRRARRSAARPGAGAPARPARASRPRWRRWSTTSTRTSTATSSRSRTRSSSCTSRKKCLINQREVGPHTLSFANALRSRAARGPGLHPGRRNARPGDHPPGADRRGNRPPGVRHAAHLARPPRPSTGSSTCSRRRKRKWSARCCRSRCAR